MINVKSNSLDLSGQWSTFFVKKDIDIKLKIRPYLSEFGGCISKQANIPKKGFNKKFGELVMNYILEDFRGVGVDENTPLEPTREGKKNLVGAFFPSIFDFIMAKSIELGKERINQIIEVKEAGHGSR